MIDIDYLKWKIDMADGFSYRMSDGELMIDLPDDGSVWIKKIEEGYLPWDAIFNPFLTQRAIEGFNRRMPKGMSINQGWDATLISSGCDLIFHETNHNYDEAKEATLKYAYEEENK